jgi:hypothetical protein
MRRGFFLCGGNGLITLVFFLAGRDVLTVVMAIDNAA